MARIAGGAPLASLEPSGDGSPLFVRLYRLVRGSILEGRLPAGARLPSTRTVARDLGLSRTTAEEAFAQLLAEGFIERRRGSGTYVAAIESARVPLGRSLRPPGPAGPRRLAERGASMRRHACFPEPAAPRAFAGASAAVESFPFDVWQGLVARCLRRSGTRALGTGDPAGYGPLREEIAGYLRVFRGVSCTPDQVVITTSSQQALDLAARLLIDPGDAAWIEEPGYPGARAALLASGARLVPVPVDEGGLRVDLGVRRGRDARLAYVTPSHQYPLGVVLRLERRLALLDWARSQGAWIVEDDYDSEFRYEGRPLMAIQAIDTDTRVLYVGTFTKVLFPALRLAYAVVPKDLVGAFVTARGLLDGYAATLPQMVAAEFFAQGHFGVHIRRMRELYRQRRDALRQAAGAWRRAGVELGPTDAGLHAVAHLPPASDDGAVSARAARLGVDVQPLSRYCHGRPTAPGLFLGYAALSPAEIRRGGEILRRAL